MRQIVYGDVLFLFNFSIDFLVLILVGCFMHLPRRPVRLISAAILGGGYAVLSLAASFTPALGIGIHILVACLMCAVAYAPTGGVFFRLVALFYTAAVLLGGVVQALCNVLASFFGTSGVISNSKKAEIFLLYAGIAGILVFAVGRLFSRHVSRENVMVEVEERGRKIVVEGIVDSGNFLKDPLSGKPVVLIKKGAVNSIIPPQIASIIEDGGTNFPHTMQRKIRFIPADGMGGHVLMVGYIPDRICLYQKDKEKRKRTVDAVLALYSEGGRDFAGCAAIVPSVIWR